MYVYGPNRPYGIIRYICGPYLVIGDREAFLDTAMIAAMLRGGG